MTKYLDAKKRKALVMAPAKRGRTFLCLDEALALATGQRVSVPEAEVQPSPANPKK